MKVPVQTVWSASFIDIWRPLGMILSSFHDICCPNPVIVNILFVRKQSKIPITCDTDDKESNLNISINKKGEQVYEWVNTYRQSYFHGMIQRNYIFACPNLIEKPIHDFNSLIPN